MYGMTQNAELNVSVIKDGTKITIAAENIGKKPYTVRLVNVQASSADGTAMEIVGNDTVLTPNAEKVVVNI